MQVPQVQVANIDWARFPVRIYTGTTLSGLVDLMEADGAGTYIVAEGLTGNTNEVISSGGPYHIVGPGWRDPTASSAGRINVTITSGILLDIQIGYMYIDGLTFYQSGTDDITILKYSSASNGGANKNFIKNCYIKMNGVGKAIYLGNNAGVVMEDVKLLGNEALTAPSTTGFGLYCDAGVDDPVYTYLFMRNVQAGCFEAALRADQFAWVTADKDSGFGWSKDGVLIVPNADHSVRDFWFMGSLFDYNSQSGLRCDGAGESIGIHLCNCHVYSTGNSDNASAISLNTVDGVWISSCQIIIANGSGTGVNNGVYMYQKCQHVFVSDCLIDAPTYGVAVEAQTGGNISQNFRVVNNSFETVANSVKIGSGNKNYVVALNIGPANSDSGSSNKVVDHNITEA